MQSVINYINALRDDFYNVLVLNENIDHRVGYVASNAAVSETAVNSLGLDYETEYVDDNDNILIPETGQLS